MSEAAPRDVDAAPVAWREAGAGPAVLFLHGLGMTRTGFDPQLAALADRFRCVAWDMPGYGASPAPDGPLTFPGLAAAVDGLLDALGVDAAHLVGLSLGGMVALHTALEHPHRVRSLALLDSSPAFGLDGTQPDTWRRARLAPLDEGVTPAAMAEPVLRSIMAPDVADDVLATAVASMARIPSDGLRAAVECLPTHDVRARLGDIHVPTLVVVGERDEETPPAYAQALADGISGAALSIVPGAGHISNLEAPAAVNALLGSHLAAAERAVA
jgi:pimeloyl-ACP methyl ester carboxylesterase